VLGHYRVAAKLVALHAVFSSSELVTLFYIYKYIYASISAYILSYIPHTMERSCDYLRYTTMSVCYVVSGRLTLTAVNVPSVLKSRSSLLQTLCSHYM
jgi:hypothetical protein